MEGPSENQIFVADTEGKITELQDFVPALIPQLKEIFAQYFGFIEDVRVTPVSGLAIGDDVPNWEDYKQLN